MRAAAGRGALKNRVPNGCRRHRSCVSFLLKSGNAWVARHGFRSAQSHVQLSGIRVWASSADRQLQPMEPSCPSPQAHRQGMADRGFSSSRYLSLRVRRRWACGPRSLGPCFSWASGSAIFGPHHRGLVAPRSPSEVPRNLFLAFRGAAAGLTIVVAVRHLQARDRQSQRSGRPRHLGDPLGDLETLPASRGA